MSLQRPLLRARARTFGSGPDPGSPPPPRKRDAWNHANQHVRVRVNFYNVSSIEVARHRFDCDLFIEASWTDRGALKLGRPAQDGTCATDTGMMVGGLAPTEAWEQPPFNRAKNAGKLWTPRLRVRNVLAQGAEADNEEWFTVYYCKENGQQLDSPIVCQKRRISGTFYEHFELAAYPWDAQDLTISSKCGNHTPDGCCCRCHLLVIYSPPTTPHLLQSNRILPSKRRGSWTTTHLAASNSTAITRSGAQLLLWRLNLCCRMSTQSRRRSLVSSTCLTRTAVPAAAVTRALTCAAKSLA